MQKLTAALQGFREGTFRILIATDVAARGLDIPEVDVVVQVCRFEIKSFSFPLPE